jgi:NTE family protein
MENLVTEGPTLPISPLFDGMGDAARAAFASELEWFTLPGGMTLFEEGEVADALYIVLAGALGVIGKSTTGEGELIARIQTGESVGELGLLGNRPRPITVVALRDTSLLRMSKATYEKLGQLHPHALLRLTVQFFQWVQWPRHTGPVRPAPRTVALVPLSDSVRITDFARALAARLASQGKRLAVVAAHLVETETSYHALEAAHHLVLYQAEPGDSSWTRMCMRRADRILLVADAEQTPGERIPALDAAQRLHWRSLDMVLLQSDGRTMPAPGSAWLEKCPVGFHCHVRPGNDGDMKRLARAITGRAVGVVLSGGGARAYGHIGVVKALHEAGIAVDLIGGTSMGAIIAACFAAGWDDAETLARMRQAFLTSNPLSDYALPLVALTRGRKVTRLLQANFGDWRIEDLWLPYFSLAANLTTGTTELHRRGPLWRALRASVAIPGLLPPLIDSGAVLVDGAVMNNLPADIMCGMGRGPVIGVDVTRYHSLRAGEDGISGPAWRRWLVGDDGEAPGIVSILLRAATVGSDAETLSSRTHTDLLLEPPMPDIGMRDWKAFDRAVETGYRYAAARLAEVDLSHYVAG